MTPSPLHNESRRDLRHPGALVFLFVLLSTLTAKSANGGILWVAGDNGDGQLGLDWPEPQSLPVSMADGVNMVAAGYSHTLFLKSDGSLWGMGANDRGQLGVGDTTNRATPVKIASGVRTVAAGWYHSLFVTADGTLWGMGPSQFGELGDRPGTLTPTPIATGVQSVAASYGTTLFIKTDGTLWALGWNDYGQLFDGTDSYHRTPVQIATNVRTVAVASSYSLVLTNDGALWGAGRIPDGTTGGYTVHSQPVQLAGGIQGMAAGESHILFLKTDGTLWGLGSNYWGQLGDGTNTDRAAPVQIAANVEAAAAGAGHTLFVKTDGTLWATGRNESGQLGDGTTTYRYAPVWVANGVLAAGAGRSSSFFVASAEAQSVPPVITAQPVNQATAAGQSAVFSLVVLADSGALFRWQRLPGGSLTWADLTDDSTYAGTATRALTVNGCTADMDGDSFRCLVTNSSGPAVSSPASLSVVIPLAVTTWVGQPGTSGTADGAGSAARFEAPTDVTVDSSGTVYVADGGSHTIRRITPDGVVTTLAGRPNAGGYADGPAANAQFAHPTGVAVDGAGNVYVSDTDNSVIRRIAPDGMVTTLAGLAHSPGTADGSGSAARFNGPSGIVVDAAGNLYVADLLNDRIRQIAPNGSVTTLYVTIGGLIGPAAPQALALDGAGGLYVVEAGGNTVSKVNLRNSIGRVIAGLSFGAGSDDGPISVARYNHPSGIALDGLGNVYVADSDNYTVRQINRAGVTNTVAGFAGFSGSADGIGAAARFSSAVNYRTALSNRLAMGPTGILYVADTANHIIRKCQPHPSISAPLTVTTQPVDRTFTTGQNAVFTVGISSAAGANYQWRRLAAGASSWEDIHDGAGYSGATAATLTVAAVTSAVSGDSFRCVVTSADRAVVSAAATLTVIGGTPLTVTTLAGQAGVRGRTDGTGSAARFTAPADVTVDNRGNIYVADTNNQTIRKIAPGGSVTTLAGLAGIVGSTDGAGSAARFFFPAGIAADAAGNVFVSDTNNDTIREITPAGVVTTVAGQADIAGTTDAVGSAARFNGPSGIVADSAGVLYIADSLNNAIRKVTADGTVTTVYPPVHIASGPWLSGPQGLALDHSGNLYVADTNNDVIRKIDLASGMMTTVAGQVGLAGSNDGSASQARFHYPSGVAVDAAGNVYVADTDNHAIRQIAPDGSVSTVAGLAGAAGSADGVGTAARFTYPAGIASDGSGNLYVADTNNDTVRVAYLPAIPAITTQPQSQTVNAGAAVQFTVAATGRPVPSYQWCFNGGTIGGATGTTLSLSYVQSASAGTYSVTVSNTSGSVTSQPATLTVNAAPTTPPPSGGSSATSGGGAMAAWFVFAFGSLLLIRLEGLRLQITLAVLVAFLLPGTPVFAQARLRVLHTFAGGPSDGAGPYGSVAVSGSAIYGMTYAGGTSDLGTLFRCAPDGTNFAVVHSFTGGPGDGATPYQDGSLVLDGNVVYGMTYTGGSNDLGTIFKVNTDGSGFTLLHSFASGAADGAHPRGSLTRSGTMLYGTTSQGGESGQGTVFRIGIDGSGFAILHSFFGAPFPSEAVPGGAYPKGTLTLIDSALYGMAEFTTYDYYRDPMVFRLNTDGTGYTSLANFFSDYQRGDSLTSVGSTLYGLTGTSWYTNAHLFRLQADGTGIPDALTFESKGAGFSDVHTFESRGTRFPVNTPATDGTTLFFYSVSPMPYSDFPWVYRVNTDGTGFEVVAEVGDSPVGSLTLFGSVLYGFDSRRLFAVVPGAPRLEGVGAIGKWIEAGKDLTIAATVSGSPPFSFQWQRLAAGADTWMDLQDDTTYSGTTTGTLTIHAVTPDMCGDRFRLVCSNSSGSDTAEFPLVTYRPLTVTTVAGAAAESGSTDGSGTEARFTRPTDVAVDGAGNVFIADTDNHIIRKLTPAGVVSTIAGQAGVAGAADGSGSGARFNRPSGIAVDQVGNVYVADTDNDTVRRITSDGIVTTIAGLAGSSGSDDGIRASARFNKPAGIVAAGTGTLFVADTLNHVIRQISPTGMVTTLAGAAGIAGSADGTGSAARFFGPQGLAADDSGNLWVADTNNHTVRKIVASTGNVTTFARRAGDDLYAPSGIAVDRAGYLYVIDSQSNQIEAITTQGSVSTSAGKYVSGASIDGVGDAARFNHPTGIAISPNGEFYVADADNHTIRLAYFPEPLAITAQPQDQTVTAGAGATFSVVATGHPVPTYQWSLNGAAIAGATASTYTIANAQPANAGSYTVAVTNDSSSVTSNPATLTVNAAPTPPPPSGGSGASAGGGAIGAWFVLAVAILATFRRTLNGMSTIS